MTSRTDHNPVTVSLMIINFIYNAPVPVLKHEAPNPLQHYISFIIGYMLREACIKNKQTKKKKKKKKLKSGST